jgi:uncharacterized protein (TIGR03000 family)
MRDPLRLLGCTIAVVALPALTLAQNPAQPRVLPIRPAMTTPFPGNTGGYVGSVVGGKSQTSFLDLSTGRVSNPIGYYAAPWPGGLITPNGLYVPNNVAIGEFRIGPAETRLPPTERSPRMVELSGEYPATLALEFPAAAKVWLDGKSVAGAASKERVLTSPVLKPGQRHTFKIRAEWDAGGKTYEYAREVTVEDGGRSKLLVLSGSLVAGDGKR